MTAKALHRVLRGLGAGAYSQVVTVIVQLVGVPILLHAWGPELYGEWLILFAIPAYLSMTDLGLSQSAGNDMTARVARGDRAGALAVFQSLAVVVYAVVVAGLIVVTALLWALPLEKWLHFSAMSFGDARLTVLFFAAEVFVRLPNGVTHAGFRANGDYAFHVNLDSNTRLIQFAGVWLFAFGGASPVIAAAAFFGTRMLGTVTSALLLARRHLWLRFGFASARLAELRLLVKPALANMAIPLAQALNVQGLTLMVGVILGPLAVVTLSTLRTLTRLPLQLVFAVSHAAEPELAAAYGANDTRLAQSIFIHVLRAGFWSAFAAAVGLALLGGFILALWTHGKVAMDPMLFVWLLCSAVAGLLWYSALIVLKANNQHMSAASLYVLSAGGAVAVAGLLLEMTGHLANAGLALLLMDAAMVLYTLQAACRQLNIPLSAVLQAANPCPLLSLLLGKYRTPQQMP